MDEKPAIDFIEGNNQLIESIKPKDTTSLPTPETYSNASREFWMSRGQVTEYEKGVFLGRGDKTNILFDQFLKRLSKTIEELTREALAKNDMTSEGYKDIFDAIQADYRILNGNLKRDKTAIKEDQFIPLLHGFINAYVTSIIAKSKQETDG
jgi:hypothetical protein